VEAVDLCPGLADAQAARGEAAARLGLLAEAVCAWETAELLGGVPTAAAEAEACRTRLDAFFEEKAKERPERESCPRDDADEASDGEDERGAAGRAWRQSWQRHEGQPQHGRPFGFSGSKRGGGSGVTPNLPPELHRHLVVLGLANVGTTSVASPAGVPSAEEVRRAYRKLALERHPDKGGSKALFQELQAAYEGALGALAMH